MDLKLCVGCRKPTVAEIKDLKKYNRHSVPVWYCKECKLSTPVKRKDRHQWIKDYHWDPPGFIYGNRLETTKCLGCGKETLSAGCEFLLNEAFPFFEDTKPTWVCATCGFCDKVAKEDGELWADKFKYWG